MIMQRIRFAWWPVRLWRLDGKFVEQTNTFVWWGKVHEVLTIWGNWTAYEHNQHETRGKA
jgi:hypothetical protein